MRIIIDSLFFFSPVVNSLNEGVFLDSNSTGSYFQGVSDFSFDPTGNIVLIADALNNR